jgi:hypothetical protein
MPRDVLAEYESVAREAGFEPGVVLPSTLATLTAITDDEPTLLVNAGSLSITTAILNGGQLLLHRSLDLQPAALSSSADLPLELLRAPEVRLPLVDRYDSASEWAAQEPSPEHGRNPYADRLDDEAAVQNVDGITGRSAPPVFTSGGGPSTAGAIARGFDDRAADQNRDEPGDISHSPYALPTLDADLNAELHHAILVAPTSLGTLTDPSVAGSLLRGGGQGPGEVTPGAGFVPAPVAVPGEEIAHAVSVAVSYFEDTLSILPRRILSAGPLGAEALASILYAHGVAQTDDLRVRELVEPSALAADAVTPSVPRATLAGVLGAVRG